MNNKHLDGGVLRGGGGETCHCNLDQMQVSFYIPHFIFHNVIINCQLATFPTKYIYTLQAIVPPQNAADAMKGVCYNASL